MSEILQEYQKEQEYHQGLEVSRTGALWFNVSPAHFKEFQDNPPDKTPDMKFGEAYHYLILEPHLFEKFVGVLDDNVKAEKDKGWTSKANQQAKKEFQEKTPIVITQDEYDKLLRMRDKLYSKRHIMEYLNAEGIRYEVAKYAKLNGIDVRCKIDGNHPGFNIDLKTAQSASESASKRDIVNKKYYVQGGMYTDIDSDCETDLNDPKPFGFIFQEKTAPFECSLIWLNHELIAKGIMEYRTIVEQINQCYQYDVWPGYEYWSTEPDNSFVAAPPEWMRR